MVNIVTIVCSHRDSFMDLKKLTVNLFLHIRVFKFECDCWALALRRGGGDSFGEMFEMLALFGLC